MRFDPSTSLLAGRDPVTLQADLAKLQQAYVDISSGAKGENYAYTQGDGAKSVSYSKANIGDLVQAIRLVQAQLGIVSHRRRAIGVRF